MRFLVTGATGFVGRHLCASLVAKGHEVRGTLRSTQLPATFPVPIEWAVTGEIGAHTRWDAALAGVDYVIHLAALAHQLGMAGVGRADEFRRVNTDGTRGLAEAVARTPHVARLVFVSSIGAVRSLSDGIVCEATPAQPDNDYGWSKLWAEEALKDVMSGSSNDWCIVRPTLVYGPGNPGNMARLLKLVKTGVPLPLASVRNRRSFLFIGNLVDVLIRCAIHPGASRREFLVSDGDILSTPELITRIARQNGTPVRLFPMFPQVLTGLGRLGDILSQLTGHSVGIDSYSVNRLFGSLPVDSSFIRNSLAWSPPYSIDQGLQLTFSEAPKQ